MMPRTAIATASLFLVGCASFSPDGGFDKVSDLTKERTGQAVSDQRTDASAQTARARVAELLKQPLTADSAVEIALLNNRGLQASFAELGIAESDLVRAGRLANPSFSFGRLQRQMAVVEIERAVLFDVLGLLTMPVAKRGRSSAASSRRSCRLRFDAVGLAGRRAQGVLRRRGRAGAGRLLSASEGGRRRLERAGQAHGCRPATSASSRRCASRRSTPTPRRSWRVRSTRRWPSASG